MTRADALNYLMQQYGELASEAQWDSQHAGDSYNGAIDNTWRQFGVVEASLATATVDDSNILPAQALLSFYILRRFLRTFAMRVDVNIAGSISASRSQLVKQLQSQLQAAQEEATGYGYYVGGDSFVMGRLSLDYLEPTGTEF